MSLVKLRVESSKTVTILFIVMSVTSEFEKHQGPVQEILKIRRVPPCPNTHSGEWGLTEAKGNRE